MSGKFIIVERDDRMKDRGVFTGQIQVVDSHMFMDEERSCALQCIDGIASPDIEHAFLFHTPWDAWRFAIQFQPHWDTERNRFWGFRRWVARNDGNFFPGEIRHGSDVHNPTLGRHFVPHEMIIAATADGFKQGRQSVLAEMGKAS